MRETPQKVLSLIQAMYQSNEISSSTKNLLVTEVTKSIRSNDFSKLVDLLKLNKPPHSQVEELFNKTLYEITQQTED